MKQLFLISIFLLQLISYSGKSENNMSPQKIVPGQFLKSWLLLGPIPLQVQPDPEKSWDHLPGFNTDYLKNSGGENNLAVKAGDIIKTGKKSIAWKYVQSADSIIDLAATLSKSFPVCGYAYTEVDAAEAGVQLIGLGSNDGARLFVNGVQVFDYPATRGIKPDSDLIPVLLKKGKNTLLLKIEQHGNKWGFCLRFHDFSAADALERGDLFKVWADESGVANVVSSYQPEVLNYIVQKVNLAISGIQGTEILKEERTSAFCAPLKIPSANYQTYHAVIKVQLKSGKSLERKASFTAGKRIEYTLFSHGQSNYRISLSANASESEKWAAKELQHWLKEISGAEFPVVPSDPDFKGPQIVVGNAALASATAGTASSEESFHYYNKGPDIFITGGKQRGTMYGVFEFMERELGCRWYTPTVTVIPKREELKFAWFDHSEKPGIRVRNDFYFEAFDPIWATRNKMNGAMGYREQPGGIESYWSVHTFYPLMPPEEFFKKHPEYYSLIEGKRIYERAQLCLTNPDVLRIITERIKKRMHDSPEYLIYDVSQNDWYNPCQCDKCQAVAKTKGGESGLMIWFVNQVAEAVEKEFPDKFIGTLAYQ
ncbi:MAG TPA: DUF4838 domain-containing protein, partial [Prolixibacteraceae bacterium]|nr:DUF4838 domain-containing protein [Prolixibacteraceae bacterium]